MTTIETKRLILRNWQEGDRALFHRINADETVMEFFPFRRSRAEADALMDRLRDGIAERGFGFAAAEIRATGETIGFVGLHATGDLPALGPGVIEIGWRLAPEYWGKGYVTEAAAAWLEYGFKTLGLDEIVSFAVAHNRRSIAVMRRIGMTRDAEGDFSHPSVPDSHPHLKPHVLYRLSRRNWPAT
ncbi:GNAT family N-acetyltransferase [Nitratireductor pacificus]|uniref:N-acetyltransferase GCN5 n=1 Tax=Nitratireductor pacificus pht-3B TaxID=391937 RepID=K2N9M8_9HYPH|nr:GNAT family N-acetyltransferase [Nitratireductor pacificus]EKF20843.1 N-acetyltransferase GCN5 [Nitratireductor pacificus pht-3B]